ncbi:MAG TPA: DUF3943 domain-containing protein [Candidatus Krumholzibacteria bacterium]|nr:DUF3943 domain-containing protein [Candidatus Krumholzibacteria bacterium]
MRSSRESRTPVRSRLAVFAFAAATVSVCAGVALAASDDPPGSHRDWGISWLIRGGDAGGDYGEFLQKAVAWDLDLYKQKGNWRFGAGLTFGSLGMKSPYEHEPEWAHFETYGLATRVFRNDESVRPYLQGRLAIVRMHPRSELFLKKPVEELAAGESPTDAVNGVGISFIPGVEFDIADGFAVDLSTYLNWYITGRYDMSGKHYETTFPYEDPGSGVEWGARVGATWRPRSFEDPARASAAPDTTPLDPENRFKDAWGVTRSRGWAAGEVLMINFGASMFNEYVRQANFNQISPRSFWANVEEGFTYDDNKFKTNQMIHPFNGSTYYNSGRANGLSFWPSTVYSLMGAFIWEAMGETHPMSFNDMIATGVGGIAFGETTYRLSSAVLDNTSGGNGRTWREIGGFLINPVRGFNRFVTGDAARIHGNPSSPYDWRPPRYYTTMGVGARVTGRGESISDSTQTQGVIDLYINHGSPWENERRKPFDHFDMGVQLNGDDKVPIGRFQIRGDLFSKPFGGETGNKHAVAVVQYFDYVNNNAYEFGGQSFGVALFSRFRPAANFGIMTRLDVLGTLLGAVNSEYAYVVETPEQERLREYDYGPGAGFSLEAAGVRSGRRLVLLGYRAQWINVTNGSIWVPAGNPGSDANHFVQAAMLKLSIPVRGAMSVGLDGALFFRQSHFSREEFVDTNQRVPQARMYLAWDTSR